MVSEAVIEELEVLESIYPDELLKESDRDISINAEPDDPIDDAEKLKVRLSVHYTDEYPDSLPDLALESVEGEISKEDLDAILDQLQSVGSDNIGMAMTFTLVSCLREQLSQFARRRTERRVKEEREKERLVLEEEETRTRGTPVTVESFKAWKIVFDQEMSINKAQEEAEKTKALTAKEREEFRKITSRLSGRQLFERGGKNLEDDTLLEEGVVSVDASEYERTRVEEEQDEGVSFSDSD